MRLKIQHIATTAAIVLSAIPVSSQNVYEYGSDQSKVSKTGSGTPSSDFSRYLAALESKITSRGPAKFIGRVSTKFTINKNGSLGPVLVSQSSSMPQIDSAAIDAVKHSAPFDALPEDAGKSVDIQFSFEGTSKGTVGHAIRLK
jgi:TonB family protein